MADPSAYNQVTQINPQLAGALYQYNVLSATKQASELDPMLLQQNAFQEQISRTVYIGNLHPSIVEDQIIKVFGTCGTINLAKIACEGMGLKADAGTRFGFIEFESRKGADAATQLDGILLGGRPVRVGPSNGPIIQPTAYGPGAATMRNKPPLYKVSAGGFVILDEKAEEDINTKIESKMNSVLERLNRKIAAKASPPAPVVPAAPHIPAPPSLSTAPRQPTAQASVSATPTRSSDKRADVRSSHDNRRSLSRSPRGHRERSLSKSHHTSHHHGHHHQSRDRSRSRSHHTRHYRR